MERTKQPRIAIIMELNFHLDEEGSWDDGCVKCPAVWAETSV